MDPEGGQSWEAVLGLGLSGGLSIILWASEYESQSVAYGRGIITSSPSGGPL